MSSTREMHEKLRRYQTAKIPIKFNMAIQAVFMQAKDHDLVTVPPVYLVTDQDELYPESDLSALLTTFAGHLGTRITAFEGNDSGWVLKTLNFLDTTIWKLDPTHAETYFPLSTWIRNTCCVVNVKNTDNECYRHAVMAGLYNPENNRNIVSSYKRFYEENDAPDFSNLEYPMKVKDIGKFESMNPDVSVNVYGTREWTPGSGRTKQTRKTKTLTREVPMDVDEDEPMEVEDEEPADSVSTADDEESESEDEETEEDRQFVDNTEYNKDVSFYRQVDAELPYHPEPVPEPEELPHNDNKRGYVYPLRIAPDIRQRHVNLLCTEDPDDEGKYHYSTIRKFGGLMRGQYYSGNGHNLHFCYR